MGGLDTGGSRIDSQLTFESVGDIVRMSGGRTLSCERGCLMASQLISEELQRGETAYLKRPVLVEVVVEAPAM